MVMKSIPCLILDVTDAMDQAPGRPTGCELIPSEKRPTVLQPDRETADREVVRLARMNPGRRFAVFEACAMGITIDVPTHISITGEVILTGKQAVLVRVDEDDGVPF